MAVDGINMQGMQKAMPVIPAQQVNKPVQVDAAGRSFEDGSQSNQGREAVAGGNQDISKMDAKQLKAAIDDTNKRLVNSQARCEFSVHEGTNRITIKIIDSQTDEVIREVPAEKTLEMIEKAWEIAGLLVDEKR